MSDPAFEAAQLERVKAQITAYNDALDALALLNGVQSYSMDTGQTKQAVTRADIPMLTRAVERLEKRYSVWCMRVNGGSAPTAVPGW